MKSSLTVFGVLGTLVLVALLAACSNNKGTETTIKQTNDKDDFSTVKLFEIDGCTIYRFYDQGHFRYFTNCKNSGVGTMKSQSCGKTQCPKPDTIETR